MLAMIAFAAAEIAIAAYFPHLMQRLQKSWQRTMAVMFFLFGAVVIVIGEPITYGILAPGKWLKDDLPAYATILVGHVAALLVLVFLAFRGRNVE